MGGMGFIPELLLMMMMSYHGEGEGYVLLSHHGEGAGRYVLLSHHGEGRYVLLVIVAATTPTLCPPHRSSPAYSRPRAAWSRQASWWSRAEGARACNRAGSVLAPTSIMAACRYLSTLRTILMAT